MPAFPPTSCKDRGNFRTCKIISRYTIVLGTPFAPFRADAFVASEAEIVVTYQISSLVKHTAKTNTS